jgi:hypothetical protein
LTTEEATRRPRDPDFDRANPNVPMPTEDVIRYYQRLVVNPFLGASVFLLGLCLCGVFAESHLAALMFPAFGLAGCAGCFLLRFHCLDCGTTGPFRRWRSHACAAVWERWNERQSFWVRLYPNPQTQLALWFVAIAVLGFLVAAVRQHR